MHRYAEQGRVEIQARIEQVYRIATDPDLVPRYAHEVAGIETLHWLDPRTRLVRSHVRVGPVRIRFVYRYRYRPPTHYSGVQQGGRLLRGYFTFAFEARGDCTLVTHAEGVLSPMPGLAAVAGLVYFRGLGGDGVRGELERLKELVESDVTKGRVGCDAGRA